MNKHVLLVMKYINNTKSVTKQELWGNMKSARYERFARIPRNCGKDLLLSRERAYITAEYACITYEYGVDVYLHDAVDNYFAVSGEDFDDYLNEIGRNEKVNTSVYRTNTRRKGLEFAAFAVIASMVVLYVLTT